MFGDTYCQKYFKNLKMFLKIMLFTFENKKKCLKNTFIPNS